MEVRGYSLGDEDFGKNVRSAGSSKKAMGRDTFHLTLWLESRPSTR